MKFLKSISGLVLLTCSSIAFAAVNTATQPKQIQFDGDKPVYKTGTIIKNGQVIEYKKCQYLNPESPDKAPADPNISYCKDVVDTGNQE